jgi:hypothetical protein
MGTNRKSLAIGGFLLTLLGTVIGYSIQHLYTLQAKRAELWNQSKYEAYGKYFNTGGSVEARFSVGLLGSEQVIISVGAYEKEKALTKDKARLTKVALDLFEAMRKDLTPSRSNVSPEAREFLQWVMFPDYSAEKLTGQTR